MKNKLFVVYDTKSETYTTPTSHPARGQAIRSFSDAVNSGDGVLSAHPADFTLFEIGEFDILTGEIAVLPAKEALGNGVDFVDSERALKQNVVNLK